MFKVEISGAGELSEQEIDKLTKDVEKFVKDHNKVIASATVSANHFDGGLKTIKENG